MLNVVRHELELVCESDKIPDDITIDVTGKDVGDAIHISEVTLPAGTESAITDRDFTIATLVAPSALKSEPGEGGETPAGEVPTADEAEAEEAAGEDGEAEG